MKQMGVREKHHGDYGWSEEQNSDINLNDGRINNGRNMDGSNTSCSNVRDIIVGRNRNEEHETAGKTLEHRNMFNRLKRDIENQKQSCLKKECMKSSDEKIVTNTC